MLSSIHPFGERSRNNSFGRTAGAHIFGSALGGLALGALAGGIGLLFTAFGPSDTVRAWVIAVGAIAAFGLEATSRGRVLPTRSRQVDDISTIITTALVHLLVLSMVVVGSLPLALMLGTVFGTVRGATLLAARSIDNPESLRVFHQRLDHYRVRSHVGAVASLAIASAVGLTGAIL